MKILIACLLFSMTSLFAYEIHTWDGENYSENSASQKKTADYILERFKFDGTEKILDLGCGEGKIASLLSSLAPKGEVLGIDLSKSMISYAQKNFPHNEYPNLEFSTGDATALSFTKEFDLIFSFTALQWVKDHNLALEGMYQSLKPGGTLALAMPLGLPLSIEQALDEMMHQKEWRSYYQDFQTGFNFVEPSEYQSLLQKNHFQVSHFEKHPQKDVFPSKEALLKFMSQWLPHLRVIPENLKETFMTQMLDRYFQLEGIDPDCEVYFYPNHLVVIAHKV